MVEKKATLSEFLAEVSNWTWDDFVRAEKNDDYTTNQSIIFALIRACAMQKLPAIKTALNRIDGKLKTPVKIEYPKIFFVYPNATLKEGDVVEATIKDDPILLDQVDAVVSAELITTPPVADNEIADMPEPVVPSMTLRETLKAMSDERQSLPADIVRLANETHQWVLKNGDQPPEIPRVKSVVAANLLLMAQNKNIDALTEVFDQIDGKLVETIQILGEDIYISDFSLVAPDRAELNKNGVLQIEATETQNHWMRKLSEEQKS